MAFDVRPLKQFSNETLLDAIRSTQNDEYQARIPAATKAGIQGTLRSLEEYRPQWNQFQDALINQIGLVIAHNKSWTNPLAPFKKGLLTGGDTIEEYMVGLVKAKNYDSDREALEKDIFGSEKVDVQTNFHRINRQDFYKITVNQALLKRAFLQDGGLQTFVTKLMQAPATSDQWDEFLITTNLFREYEAAGGFFKIQVPDVKGKTSDSTAAKDALRAIRETSDNLAFLSEKYNAAHMPTAADPDELVLFATPEFKSGVDVNALAAAFNVDYVSAKERIIPIPEGQFGIEGSQAILTTKDFFIIGDTLFETTSAANPVGLHTNYFLHHHQIVSASRFVPAVLFTTHAGDVITIISTPVVSVASIVVEDAVGATPTSFVRGDVYQFDATVTTNPADGVNTAVRWSVAGNTSNRTWISPSGVLHVAGDEGASNLTVTATSTWLDPSGLMKDGKADQLTLAVTGDALTSWPVDVAVTGISIDGVAVAGFAPGTYAYSVAVPGGTTPTDGSGVEVYGPPMGDVDITVSADGKTVTVSSPASPGDPVYTVTVTAA